MTIAEYAEQFNAAGRDCWLEVLSDTDFANSNLALDVVYSIAIFDVVLRETRESMAVAAARNLRVGGLYVLVVPRNDSSILKRCAPDRAYKDGHLFQRNGAQTFYCNFRSTDDLLDLVIPAGFTMIEDLSIYRQAVLFFERE